MSFWPSSFIQEVSERRVVFFIGAGISIAAGNANNQAFPNWKNLLLKLSMLAPKASDRRFIEKLIRKAQYLEAAQIIHDTAPAADFSAKLRTLFAQTSSISTIYEDIIQMDPKIVATTNYDTLIEKNYEHYSGKANGFNLCRYNQTHALDDIRSPLRVILKVHGCITEPQNVILSRSSYFRARQTHAGFFNLLSAIMTTNTVLFLGYSFSDPDIQLILENVHISNNCNHPHYALVPKFPHASLRNVHRDTYNIHPLEYPPGKPESFASLLSELRQEVERFRVTRGLA